MAGVIQEISSGKNNKNRDIFNALPLCMILVAGSILSWFKIVAIDLVFEAAAFGIAEIVLCLTAVYGLLSSKDKKWAFYSCRQCGSTDLYKTGTDIKRIFKLFKYLYLQLE